MCMGLRQPSHKYTDARDTRLYSTPITSYILVLRIEDITVVNTPNVFRGTCQVTIAPKRLATCQNTHEKARFDLDAELHGPQRC
ncbi:hypothetical protein ACN42_g3850 [Penicillium freii]|uniref:Uncharacterized protein n=1 Tax=Penicillium freii TaxID=48697 RepID=A0A101MMH2_PENFR|nr:hypothetical protein ACN42_g3850 [Penicillium freii]